jgi:NurA-like 5'-3' nuclease
MKTSELIEILKKYLNSEVRKIIREELTNILKRDDLLINKPSQKVNMNKEILTPNGLRNFMKESQVPNTLKKSPLLIKSKNSTINKLLEQTATEILNEDINPDEPGFGVINRSDNSDALKFKFSPKRMMRTDDVNISKNIQDISDLYENSEAPDISTLSSVDSEKLNSEFSKIFGRQK